MRRPPAVARVLQRITTTARTFGMFEPGDLVVVCVSGGPDSLCLVESLTRLRRLLRIRLSVLHVDHGLRPGSSDDARYVRRLAARLDLAFEHVTAAGRPSRGESVEAWARGQRRAAALAVANDIGAQRIATGHTLDDQAETVLMRALSGAGAAGIAGIPPVLGPWVRPMLEVRREETEAFCSSLGLRPRVDPTNADPRYLRNAIRLRGLPALERAVGHDVRRPLARAGALLREDDAELTRIAGEAYRRIARRVAVNRRSSVVAGVDLDGGLLPGLPAPIAGRVILRAASELGISATRADVLAVLDLAAGKPGRRRSLSMGLRARRGQAYVHLARTSSER
ncbi:MAG: tRNA lysidine(34) synthetase TilS [Actinobacteria bacterium]|nr:tRNA lysidine(34) synthetase TilS [Actinomycetota bacterium]